MLSKLRLTNGYQIDLAQSARLLGWASRQPQCRRHSLASRELGLPANMLTYVAGTMEAMGLMRASKLEPTDLGHTVHRFDQYLTNPLTPWILHYHLASNPRHLVWFRLANEVIVPNGSMGVEDAKTYFADVAARYAKESVGRYLGSEIGVFFDTYADGALSRIGYLERDEGRFAAPSGLRVPPVAFGYALLQFSAAYRPGMTALPIEDIATAPSSPGRVFLMRESEASGLLERLHRSRVIDIESKGHLNQVRFAGSPAPVPYLEAHFADREE